MRSVGFITVLIVFILVPAIFSQGPKALALTGDYPLTHDPSIARDGNSYYVFSTSLSREEGQFPIRCSSDLVTWKRCGHVFDQIPAWIHEASPKTKVLWAPDVSYFRGKYHLYYAYSSFGSNISGIALATNETLDPASPKYRWSDEGLVLKSVETDDFNAIDPNIVLDAKGQPWLSFGSFWNGIKMRKIDAVTGKLYANDSQLYALASRVKPENAAPVKPGLPADWQAIEAPFIVRHGKYYYLFVSFDLCCRGTHSSYRTMVGRSRQVTGPYIDAESKPLLAGGGTQVLAGNSRWLGPGGESVLQQANGDYLVYHAYDAASGKPALQISTITWKGGWPHAALRDNGEAK